MFNNKFISIKSIIDGIQRGKLFKELSYEAAIDYAVDCYRLLNSESAEITKPAKIKISNYRGLLPEDFERMLQSVKTNEDFSTYSPMSAVNGSHSAVLFCSNSPDLRVSCSNTYSLNNNYINTSFEEGYVFMSYKALAVNSRGELMLPDNVSVKLAIQNYIRWNFLTDQGIESNFIERKISEYKQEYSWYIGKTQSSMNDMSEDEFDSFATMMSSMFVKPKYGNTNNHQTFLTNLGFKKYIEGSW